MSESETIMISGMIPETWAQTACSLQLEAIDRDTSHGPPSNSGREWQPFRVKSVIGNIVRFSPDEHTLGQYFTPLETMCPQVAGEVLELNLSSDNTAAYIQWIEIRVGELIWRGKFVNSDNYQIYLERKEGANIVRHSKNYYL